MGALRSTGSVFLQWTARRKEAGEVVGVEEAAAASPEEDMVVCCFTGREGRRRSGRKRNEEIDIEEDAE